MGAVNLSDRGSRRRPPVEVVEAATADSMRAVAGADFHLPDDRFIPIRHEDLIHAIESEPERFAAVSAHIRRVAEALVRVIDQETTAFRWTIEWHYALFNPDRETLPLRDPNDLRHPDLYDAFRRHLSYLVDKANFERLDNVQIEAALETANSQGLRIRVRPERVEDLDLFVRGRAHVRRRFKTWRRPIKGEPRELDVYRRLAVVVRLRGSPFVMLKLFREIPVADLEALLPHAEVRMSISDRLKLIGGGAGALGGLATKVFWMIVGGAVVATQLLWVAIVALLGLSLRSFFGYRRAISARDSQRTRHLYDKNLSNNAGVLHTLVNLIAQEEIKEALLAYAFTAAGDQPVRGETDLDTRVEGWLRERFGVAVNFDCPDAVETLDRLDLWADRCGWRAAGPPEAIDRLERHWRERRTLDYHVRKAEGPS
ncbi:MAG: DUF3754 domain-containing protein [Planctomycetota bacterium]|jgi:hypothetical protein